MYELFVNGKPVPQGSKIAFKRLNGTLGVRDQGGNKLANWRKNITHECQMSLTRPKCKLEGPIEIHATFYILKPKSNSDKYAITKKTTADLDKLVRALFDSITVAEWWDDDVQVTRMLIEKKWTLDESLQGVQFVVSTIEE